MSICPFHAWFVHLLLFVIGLHRQHWGEISCYDSCQFCDSMSSCDFSSCYDDNVFTDTLIQKVNSILLPFLDSMQVISLTRRVTSISFKLNDSIKSSAQNSENMRMLMTNYSKSTHETKLGKVLLLGMVMIKKKKMNQLS